MGQGRFGNSFGFGFGNRFPPRVLEVGFGFGFGGWLAMAGFQAELDPWWAPGRLDMVITGIPTAMSMAIPIRDLHPEQTQIRKH